MRCLETGRGETASVTGVCAWRACGSCDRTLFSLSMHSVSLHALETYEPVPINRVFLRPGDHFAVI